MEKKQKPIGKRKRKSLWERAPFFCMGLVGLLAVLSVTGAFFAKKMMEHRKLLAPSDTFYEGIYVENVPLSGLTMEEARKKVAAVTVTAESTWAMKVTCGGEDYEIENLMENNMDEVLAEAFALGRTGTEKERLADITGLQRWPRYYSVKDTYDEGAAKQAVDVIGDQFDIAAKDAAMTGYDEETKFLFSEEKAGRKVNREDLLEKIGKAVASGDYGAVLEGEVSEVPAAMNLEQAKEAYVLLAKFRTEAGVDNEDRDHNVKLAADTVNNTLIAPGEEFSMNAVIGETTEEQGYREAATYARGEVVPEFGGGVCQVSSTIYNAVIQAGLKTTERKNHSMTVSYVPLGEDAMISYWNSDLKFENNSSGNILVLLDAYGPEVICYIYGIPVLEEGVTVKMDSRVVETLPIPEPSYVEDDSLSPGEERYKSYGKEGYRVETDLVTMKDGEEIGREFLHNSTYNPQTPVIRRNSG
ncbi:MAG: vanomycin resistance protein VanB [Lachnospiraceae bacterium]|nr:vanomycin resistance protein VanB [Lachnospiraceae bacterium]